jgi:CheY-like chemotaxis protein
MCVCRRTYVIAVAHTMQAAPEAIDDDKSTSSSSAADSNDDSDSDFDDMNNNNSSSFTSTMKHKHKHKRDTKHHRERILIVDANGLLRWALPRLREKNLYRVRVVSTAQEGLDLLAEDEAKLALKLALKQKDNSIITKGTNAAAAAAAAVASGGSSAAVGSSSGHGVNCSNSSSSSSKSGRFWVAIIDLHTPKMDGLQLCRALR